MQLFQLFQLKKGVPGTSCRYDWVIWLEGDYFITDYTVTIIIKDLALRT
jgi:hypothetical protein